MPAIVIPRRQLVQPQGYARVADGSWMTYLPSAGINSLLDGRRLSNSGVALAIGNSGVAADIDAAADYLEYTQTTDILGSFHLVAVVDLNASSTFSRLIQSGDSSGYESFSIWFAPSTSSGSVGNPNSVVIGRNSSPLTLGERWSTATNSLVRPRSGVVLEVIWGATASDTTAPQVWINGVEQTVTKVQSSTSFNAVFDPLAGAPLRIGNRLGSADRGLLGKLYLLHVEQQSRIAPYINPWRLFKPSPRRLYFSLPAAPGGDITGTISAAESGTDVCTAVGVVRVSGAIASAESVADAASSAGEVLVSGVVAVAEVGVDHASLSGAIMVAGDLSAVEQGADQAALVGSVLISGSFAAFEIGSDAASMSGQVLVSGDVSASESTVDAASLAGSVEVSGVLAAIESGQDTAVITGGGVVSPVVGIVAAVESGADVAALAGTVLVSGVTAASESESDQAGISGAVHVSGSVSAAEGQLDTAHVMGRVLVSGVIASTEAANDSASVNGSSTTITSGVIAAAEAGADAAFIPGAVFVSGNAAAFEQGADIVVAAGVVRITGAMAANEVGTDTATIRSLPRDMTPRAGYIAGAALQRTYIAGAALQRRYVA